MRVIIRKSSSTKGERRFAEILKRNHIPFKFREKIKDREVDFVIGTLVVEIGNHNQDVVKNKAIIESGYSLLFVSNRQLKSPELVEKQLITYWLYGKSSRSNKDRCP